MVGTDMPKIGAAGLTGPCWAHRQCVPTTMVTGTAASELDAAK